MPDLPPGQGAAPQGAPAQGQPGQPQGGMAEALATVDQLLTKIVGAASQSQQMPGDVKSSFQDALAAFRKAEQGLVKAMGGDPGQEPDDDDQGQGGGGATTMQQGGKGGAVPMTHANMRGQ